MPVSLIVMLSVPFALVKQWQLRRELAKALVLPLSEA